MIATSSVGANGMDRPRLWGQHRETIAVFSEIAKHSPYSLTLVEVQGWEVPNVFTTVADEHQAIRERVGLMDWSTTGEFDAKDPAAMAMVQWLIVNDASMMPIDRLPLRPHG